MSHRTQNCFCCARHTRLSSRTLSSSILYILHHWVIRAQGWWMGAERSSFCGSSQACMSRTRSPAAINLEPRPLKPASNNATALQSKEEIRSMRGEREQERESEGEKENKLFTLTSNVPQRVVKRKSWARASAYRREVSTGWGECLQEEDELMHGGGRENHLFLLLIWLDLCDNFKNNIRHK